MLISCNFIVQLFVWKYWMLHRFYKGYIEEGNIQKNVDCLKKKRVQIQKPIVDVTASWATS